MSQVITTTVYLYSILKKKRKKKKGHKYVNTSCEAEMSELKGVTDMLAVLRKRGLLAGEKTSTTHRITLYFVNIFPQTSLRLKLLTLKWLNVDTGKQNSPSKSLEMSESTSSSPSAIFEGCSL